MVFKTDHRYAEGVVPRGGIDHHRPQDNPDD